MEQYSNLNDTEIQGIPLQPDEDIVCVVKEVGRALHRTVTDSLIDTYHRLVTRLSTITHRQATLSSSYAVLIRKNL